MTTNHTRRTISAIRLLGIGALALGAGCFSLARPTPPLEQYVLGASTRPPTRSVARDPAGVTVGLRRLDLAPYLATSAIVVRRGARITTSTFRRWAEEPSAGIMRAVATALEAAPSVLAVDVAPWSARTEHDYLVQLHVAHLEGVAADELASSTGEVHVMASWEIIRSADGALMARGETNRSESGWTVGDYAGLVTRVDRGLTGLAGDLAACLSRLGPAIAPATGAPAARVMVCAAR